jgi:hypothetical protein
VYIYIYIYREREREKRKKKAQPTMSSYATENYYLQFLLIMEAISTQPYVSPQLTDIIIYPLLIKGKSKKESHFCPIELERERERERENCSSICQTTTLLPQSHHIRTNPPNSIHMFNTPPENPLKYEKHKTPYVHRNKQNCPQEETQINSQP